ncbi:hypothetical protein [Xanthobacter sp. YC-JY1]|uniref:hypothetical protein n=1 Tax=Xanthobacter sp. YC-JY1 TaxID=2419844 RepID=UPI001F3F32A3|nr:hypothetical protein [Xanthobacter sp. YC-JY1]UJX47172.1 hypothetical protein D7006_22325 [Xanthobacter sp. YC-JY1]
MRDLVHNISAVPALAPAVQAAAADGAAIDLRGFNRVAFVVNTGAIVGAGDFGVKLQEGDDGVTFADAAAAVVQGSVPATLAAASTYKLGYVGFKRFARLSLTKAGGTSLAIGAVAVLADPATVPVS